MLRRLCLLALLIPPVAASQGCSLTVSSSETVSRARVYSPPAGPRPPALLTHAPQPESEVEEDVDETDEQAWESVRAALQRPGELHDGVLTFTVPRDDLEITVQGNDVPVGAGLWSEFRFWRCPCGLINVAGQFLVADYEANDVIDALREGHIEIASVGPFLIHERPRLVIIRFLGENKRGGNLAKTLRGALTWTGKERMAPQKIDLTR